MRVIVPPRTSAEFIWRFRAWPAAYSDLPSRGVPRFNSHTARRFAVQVIASMLPVLLGVLPPVHAAQSTTLVVRETAGIRRFAYPVGAEIRLDPPAVAGSRFRLTEGAVEGGKAIPGQFRTPQEAGGEASLVSLDFEGSFMPFEARSYRVEYGLDVEAGPEPARGLTVEESTEVFLVSSGPHLVWEVPRSLAGLLRSVRAAKGEFLRADSTGLSFLARDGTVRSLSSTSPGRIAKRGPIACRLRWDLESVAGEGRSIRSIVELEIPRSKSWVRVDWSLADSQGVVRGFGAEVHLRLDGDVAFADFGADSLVYAALPRGQGASFRAGLPTLAHRLGGKPFWEILRGPEGKLEPYAPSGLTGLRTVEGWAHLMDPERCTAAAVADFAKLTLDRIDVRQDGRCRIWREHLTEDASRSTGSGTKSLRFWLHFVDFPPHVGAVTSPQSMAAPLEVKAASTGEK